jgi:hypothetical protein
MAAETEASPMSAGKPKDCALNQPVRVKVKITLGQVTKAQRGRKGIALLFL